MLRLLYDHVQPSNVGHSRSRIDKYNFPPLNLQQQPVWDVGFQQLITLRSPRYFSVFSAKNFQDFLHLFFRNSCQ
ncbi:MAG: hypothetical protein O4805_23270 [Trichodesmium sp. St16_bin2-tuft]|nr:hypothetical protein [Trichodesmium sp. St16_bin2-tuft]